MDNGGYSPEEGALIDLVNARNAREWELIQVKEQRETILRAYLDLRHRLTAMACRDGRTNPTIEPLATILIAHDRKMEDCGYHVPH